jgi:cysteinyl-tRNA synthetase
MCSAHLGGVVDLHGGGADLIFPHHENEIAQSEAYLQQEPFARYWVHNGLLQLGSDKMSKSLGNIVSISELLERGLCRAFRLMVLQSHYRAPLTFTDEGLEAADRGLDRLIAAAKPGEPAGPGVEQARGELDRLALATGERFHAAMNDDFDTPVATAALFDLARAINRARTEGGDAAEVERARLRLIELAEVLGLDLSEQAEADAGDAAPFIELLLKVRSDLRAAKQWALADGIRDELGKLGIAIEDTPAGTTWRRAER